VYGATRWSLVRIQRRLHTLRSESSLVIRVFVRGAPSDIGDLIDLLPLLDNLCEGSESFNGTVLLLT
jgi:hypothetical protein